MNLYTDTLDVEPDLFTKGKAISDDLFTKGREVPLFEEPFIPIHISHIAVHYSIPFIFFTSTISFYCGYLVLSYLQYIVYLTSMAHWSYILESGLARTADITAVIITLLYATLVTTQYIDPAKPKIWYMILVTSVSIFVINELTLFIGLKTPNLPIEKQHTIMKNAVLVHMFFLHYLLCIGCIYCVLPI